MTATAGRRGRGRPLRRGVAAAALAVLALAAGACAAVVTDAGAGGDSLPQGDYPPVGTPGEPVCPSTWDPAEPAPPTRGGALVPEGAAEALLCRYPVPLDPPSTPGQQVLGTVQAISDPAELIAYLNGLPTSRPPQTESGCTAAAGTQHTIVVGYPDRPPAVVRLVSCALEQGGNVRYDADLRVLVAFFGTA
jgi:hypothetical protein